MIRSENTGRDEKISSRPFFWTGLAILSLVFLAGAVLTWRRWPDLVIDFGPQLYMPWRIAGGAVLYRDLFYVSGGPLSQYFHAALFKLFGPSFLIIIISNLTITAAMLVTIYTQFARAANVLTATTISVAITVIFAFAQYTGIGNNNYVAPYSHEMLHGLAFSVFGIALLARWIETRQTYRAALAGLCFGMVMLTKPDIFMALTLAAVAVLIIACKIKMERVIIRNAVAAFILAALVPLIFFFLLFLRTADWSSSLHLELSGWQPALHSSMLKNPYYQWSLGLDSPFDHLREMAVQFLLLAVIVCLIGLVFRKTQNLSPSKAWIINVIIVGLLGLAATRYSWLDSGRCLPLLCLVNIGLLWPRLQGGKGISAGIFPFVWSVFALLMLAKQGVFPRIWHTGFVLAMPAMAAGIYLFLETLPSFLKHRYQVPRRPMRWAAMAVLLIACTHLVQIQARFYSAKTLAVGHGADKIQARSPEAHSVEGQTFNLALDWIEQNIPPQKNLAVIPQGAMLNYLSRRPNSSPCLDWNPALFDFYGAKKLNAALTNHPPDFIALVEWQTYEFGTGYFGTEGYGQEVMEWIVANYQPVILFGSEPLRNGLFGIKFLKLRSSTGRNTIELHAPTN